MGGVKVRRVLRDPSKAVEFMHRLGGLRYEMEAEVRGSHVTIQIRGSREEIRRAREEIEEVLRSCEGGEE